MSAAWAALLFAILLTACGPETLKYTHPLDRPIVEATYRTPARGDFKQVTTEEIVATAKRNLFDDLRKLPKQELAVDEYLGMKSIECDRSIWVAGPRSCVRKVSDVLRVFFSVIRRVDYRFDITVENWLEPEQTLQIRLSKKQIVPDPAQQR